MTTNHQSLCPSYRVLVTPCDRAAYWATNEAGEVFVTKSFRAAERKAGRVHDRCVHNVRVLTDSMAVAEVRAGRAPEF